MRRGLLLVPVLLATLASPAQARDDATTTTIRALGAEGQALFDKGAYADALDRFTRVDTMVKRHTIGVYIGRCLENLGRLNEAAERYLAVTRMDLPPELSGPENADKLKLQQDARTTAEDLREKLLPRIPAIVLDVHAPPDARVTIDGAPVDAALFGVKRSIDPGTHVVEATSGTAVATKTISLKEAEVVTVPLDLAAAPGAAPLAAAPGPVNPLAGDTTTDSSASSRRTWGYVGIGVGAAGVVVGAVATGLALSKRSDIDQQCGSGLHCTRPGTESLVNAYNSDRVISSVGFIAGTVIFAAGLTLVITAPSPKHTAAVSAFVGLSSAGVKGSF
jgi:hypothetical protein